MLVKNNFFLQYTCIHVISSLKENYLNRFTSTLFNQSNIIDQKTIQDLRYLGPELFLQY